ncbi:XrtA/PEP-CTERM system exopolysaccharide export protein [Pseudomonadota bacterium]
MMFCRSTGKRVFRSALVFLAIFVFAGCANNELKRGSIPAKEASALDYEYLIGPGDNLNIYVWRNPEVSMIVAVRPDGKITTPLVENLQASGKTPAQLARDVEDVLATYIKDPSVTVIVSGFVGPYDQQIRVVGEAAQPQALPYRNKMTLLDVMIAVGGLTEFAAGNKTRLVRQVNGVEREYVVRAADLVKHGDVSANVHMLPGDILIVPESWF